jgi:hypothetical protein
MKTVEIRFPGKELDFDDDLEIIIELGGMNISAECRDDCIEFRYGRLNKRVKRYLESLEDKGAEITYRD